MKNKSFNHFQKIASVFLIAILVFLPAACDGSTGYLPVDQNGPSITLTPAVTKQPEVPAAVPISLENATQMKELMHWGKGFPVLLHWVPDGSKFLLVTTVGIAIYDATTLTELALIPLTGGLSSLDVSRDGTMVAVGLDTEMVEIYQLSDFQLMLSLTGPERGTYNLSFSPDGKMLAAAGGNPDAVIWSIPDGHELFRLNQDGVITFSQDGKSLFIAEDNVRMRDIQSGKTLKTFSLTDPADILALTIAASGKPTPDGKLGPAAISALSTDGKNLTASCYYVGLKTRDATFPTFYWIELWNEQDSTHRILPIGEERIKSYALAPNGVEIAVGIWDGALTLWNIASGKQVKILSELSADSLAYSPDGQRLAAVLDDNTVRFWETETYREVGQITGFSGSEINAVDFSPDGQTLAVGGSDGIVNVWRFPSGALLYNLVNAYVSTPFYSSDGVETLSFSPDGSTLVTGSYYSCILRLWSVADRRVLWQSKQFGGSLEEAKFSPDGAYIGVIDPHPNFRLVNAAQGKTIASLKEVTGYDFSTDSQTVVLGMKGGKIQFYDLKNRKLGAWVQGFKDHEIHSLEFYPDGSAFAAGQNYGALYQFDAQSGERLATLIDDIVGYASIAISPDGSFLAAVYDSDHDYTSDKILLLDLRNNRQLVILKGHTHTVNDLVFSPDGKYLVSASRDGTVRIWGIPVLNK